ncbi:unnamed protein product [Dicrocoelium dendriticum]|nr:unnamed protein product [Dicrocoelium dendriticum]
MYSPDPWKMRPDDYPYAKSNQDTHPVSYESRSHLRGMSLDTLKRTVMERKAGAISYRTMNTIVPFRLCNCQVPWAGCCAETEL